MFRLKHLALGLPLKLLSQELGDERCVFTSSPLLAERRPPPSPLEEQGSPLPKGKALVKGKANQHTKTRSGRCLGGSELAHALPRYSHPRWWGSPCGRRAAGGPAEAVGRSVIHSRVLGKPPGWVMLTRRG